MILIPNHSYTSLFLLALLDVLLCTPGEEPKRPAQLTTFVGGLDREREGQADAALRFHEYPLLRVSSSLKYPFMALIVLTF